MKNHGAAGAKIKAAWPRLWSEHGAELCLEATLLVSAAMDMEGHAPGQAAAMREAAGLLREHRAWLGLRAQGDTVAFRLEEQHHGADAAVVARVEALLKAAGPREIWRLVGRFLRAAAGEEV